MCHRLQSKVYLSAGSEVCLRASWELTFVYTLNQTGSMPSSQIESVLENIPRSVLDNILRVYLSASWEHTWKHTVKQAGSISFHPNESELKESSGVYMRVCWELMWECAIKCKWKCPSERTWKSTAECTQMYTSEHA